MQQPGSDEASPQLNLTHTHTHKHTHISLSITHIPNRLSQAGLPVQLTVQGPPFLSSVYL